MQKLVNKNKQKLRAYIMLIVLAAVILSASLLMFCAGNNNLSASADSDYTYEYYDQLAYSYHSTHLDQRYRVSLDSRMLYSKAISEIPSDFNPSNMLYVLEIDPSRDSFGLFYDTLKLNFSFSDYDRDLFGNFILDVYYSDSPRFTYSYDASGSLFDNNRYSAVSINDVGDLLFLSLDWSKSKFFVSSCSKYADNPLDTRSAYVRSLENIVFDFDITFYGNSLGFYLLSGFLNVGAELLPTWNDHDDFDFSCREHFYFYQQVKVPTKEGYDFAGWYYDKEFTKPYNNEPITSDIELYAKFVPKLYTVFFDTGAVADPDDSNSSGLYDTSIQVEYGGVAEYTPDVGDDKHLLGWFFADGTQYMNTPIYEDTRLYAKWGCLITFDVSGGNEEIEPMVCELGQRYEFPKPTREDYEFLFWEPVGVQVWHDGDPILYDMDLVAVWEKNVFIVTFYVDDEIFDEVKVTKGDKLYAVYQENVSEDMTIVGYENVNVATIAASFDEIVVEDDMIVYLVENDDDSNPNDVSMSFWDKIKAFFAKIAEFFKKIFAWIKNLFTSGSKDVVNDQSEEPTLSSGAINPGEETVSSSAVEE